jgi:hypothetical protein
MPTGLTVAFQDLLDLEREGIEHPESTFRLHSSAGLSIDAIRIVQPATRGPTSQWNPSFHVAIHDLALGNDQSNLEDRPVVRGLSSGGLFAELQSWDGNLGLVRDVARRQVSMGPRGQIPSAERKLETLGESFDFELADESPIDGSATINAPTVQSLGMAAGEPAAVEPFLIDIPDGIGADDGTDQSGGAESAMGGSCCCSTNAEDDQLAAIEDLPTVAYHLLDNDSDPEHEALFITSVTQPAFGTTTLRPDQTVLYGPPANWSGTTTFEYTVTDGQGNFSTGEVLVTVGAENDPPIAAPLSAQTNEDASVVVTLSASDVENEPLAFYILDSPAHGTLGAIDGNLVEYFPGGNFFGSDSFTYGVADGHTGSEPAMVTVQVDAVSDPPGVTVTATSGTTQVEEGSDVADTYTLVLNTAPTADVVITIAGDGQVSATPQSVVFTPADWHVPHSVAVVAADDWDAEASPHTGWLSHAAQSADPVYSGIAITALAAQIPDNEIPILYVTEQSEPFELQEGNPASVTYTLALGSRPTAPVVVGLIPDQDVTISTLQMQFDETNWFIGQQVTVQAVDDSQAEGFHIRKVTHWITSGDGLYDEKSTLVHVAIVDNDGPTARDDYWHDSPVTEDTAATILVLSNDVLAEEPWITSVTDPPHGTAVIEPQGRWIEYTPDSDFYGHDDFVYWVTDSNGPPTFARVWLYVNPVNDEPVFIDPPVMLNVDEDEWVDIQLQTADVDGVPRVFTLSPPDLVHNGLPPGIALDYLTGKVAGYVSSTGQGDYSSVIVVDDFLGGQAQTVINWHVEAVNHPPTVGDPGDQVNTQRDIVGLLIPTHDLDGQTVTVTVPEDVLPSGLSVYQGALGWLIGGQISEWAPPGEYHVTLTGTDPSGGAHSVNFVWTILLDGAPVPTVTIALNNTLEPPDKFDNDDATLLWFGPPEQRIHQILPALATLDYRDEPVMEPHEHLVQFYMESPERATLAEFSFMMSHNETESLAITPAIVSDHVYDVKIRALVDGIWAGSEDFTVVNVELPRVRHWDTPYEYDGTQDRIPPGLINPFQEFVTWTPNLKGLQKVDFEEVGIGDPLIVGHFVRVEQPSAERTDCGDRQEVALLTLEGTIQTAPSEKGTPSINDWEGRNRGQLRVGAYVRQGESLLSNGFSVTAIPIALVSDVAELLESKFDGMGFEWGQKFPLRFRSDDGGASTLALSQVYAGEEVRVTLRTGYFDNPMVGDEVQTSWLRVADDWHDAISYYIGRSDPLEARISYEFVKDIIRRLLNQAHPVPSQQVSEQRVVFNDTRVGLVRWPSTPTDSGAAIRWSGSILTVLFDRTDATSYFYLTSRAPATVMGALPAGAVDGRPRAVRFRFIAPPP